MEPGCAITMQRITGVGAGAARSSGIGHVGLREGSVPQPGAVPGQRRRTRRSRGTEGRGLAGVGVLGLAVGLGLGGVFQPPWFCDSVVLKLCSLCRALEPQGVPQPRVTESQHVWGWQGPLWVPQPNPLPKQGHPEQAAQHCGQAGLEYLQRRRLHNLEPGLCHPQREEVLPPVPADRHGAAKAGRPAES